MTTNTKASDVEAREQKEFEAAFIAKYGDSLPMFGAKYQGMREGWQLARASQQPSTQWIVCADQMPGELEYVLLLARGTVRYGYYVAETDITPAHWSIPNFTCGDEEDASDVTHWQPLPAAPDTERAE